MAKATKRSRRGRRLRRKSEAWFPLRRPALLAALGLAGWAPASSAAFPPTLNLSALDGTNGFSSERCRVATTCFVAEAETTSSAAVIAEIGSSAARAATGFGEKGRDALNGGAGRDRCDGSRGTDAARRCEVRVRVPSSIAGPEVVTRSPARDPERSRLIHML